MALGGLFKSKQQRQLERDMAIQGVLDLHKRRIRDLNKHEKGYAEKAIRAKRQGDKANYDKPARLLPDSARFAQLRQSVAVTPATSRQILALSFYYSLRIELVFLLLLPTKAR